jgi:internalin A
MNKPKEILELEQIYGITLEEDVPNEYGNIGCNCYAVSTEGTVTHLNLSDNQLTEIKVLEKLVGLQRLNLCHNQLTEIKVLEKLVGLQQLNLSYNQLTEIKGFEKLIELRILYLSNNQLTKIKGLDNLTDLQRLDLSNNQLTEIKGLDNLDDLQELYLSGNQLTEIKSLDNLVGLQRLALSNNRLTEVKGLVSIIGHLKYLRIDNNLFLKNAGLLLKEYENHRDIILKYLSDIEKPKEILELEQIYKITLKESTPDKYGVVERNCYAIDAEGIVTQLNLSYNQLIKIKGLENLVGLRRLDLSHNQLTEIKGLERLVDLQELNLSHNQLMDIKVLENLVDLQELYLSYNQLTEIKVLEVLVGLQRLDLSHNQLAEIKGLERLVGLRQLYLSYNQLAEIKGLERLVGLQRLYLSGNQLGTIEGFEMFVALQELDLSDNHPIDIKGLEKLNRLQQLYLSYNQLQEIKGLEKLDGLQQLYLSVNKLREIKGLETLDGLQQLNLSHNQLKDIKELETLDSLQRLNLSHNQLADIEGLEKLIGHLDYLSIDYNPFLKDTDLLLERDENHRDIILKYFSDRNQMEVTEVTLPAKVMLLGNHASGKTTFRHYMLRKELAEQKSTPILEIVSYPERWAERTNLPEAILFDFGGQDYYHGLYQAFFSEDPIYMLFWCKNSNRNDVQQANDDTNSGTRNFTKEYWMRQLAYVYTKRNRGRKKKDSEEESSSAGPLPEPLLLIQTYAEEEEETTGETAYWEEMRLRLDNTVGEYYISLNEKTGQEPLHKLQRECVTTLLLREIKKKRRIRRKGVYYESFLNYILTWDEKKCVKLDDVLNEYGYEEENKETKRTFLKVELEMLNRKGLVLYYKENKQLSDVVWLNPAKTVEYIHKEVLSGKNVKKEYNGIVPQEDFEENLCSDKKIRELLKCEKVIFFDENKNRNDKQGARYIIPGYLKLSNEDEYYELLNFGFDNPNFTLKFRYFIPFGLINQLICLYGGNPDYKKFWRDQLVFTYNKEYMLWIKLDFAKLTIAVYIRPQQDSPSKRRLTLNEVEETIFRNILDLYWGRGVSYQTNQDGINRDKKEKEEVPFFKQVQAYLERWKLKSREDAKDDIPKDMYLSVDGVLYVRATDLEEAEKNQTEIAAYRFVETEEKTSIPKQYSQRINLYKNFTNNENICNMKKIFISFATKDEKYKNEFVLHTKTMQEEGLIEKPFECNDIELGDKWEEVIRKELNDCDIMVCLVSKHFLNSEYIRNVEVIEAMERGKKLIPIIVSPCDWTASNFGKFQAALHAKYISIEPKELTGRTEEERDAQWLNVINEMRTMLSRGSSR